MKKIMAVASGGGHWSQMKIISEAFPTANITYVTTTMNKAAVEDNNLVIHWVNDADITQKFKLLWLALSMLWLTLYLRPNIIISTGAAPGFFAIIFAKAIGAKTIWIDSIANYSKPSLSGAKVKKICDLYITQWPHQADDKANYWGHLI